MRYNEAAAEVMKELNVPILTEEDFRQLYLGIQ